MNTKKLMISHKLIQLDLCLHYPHQVITAP